jgi:CspA family cold shock protein
MWFNDARGYGFLTPDDTPIDIFVHFSALPGSGFRSLTQGARVEFDVTKGPRGLVAERVITI